MRRKKGKAIVFEGRRELVKFSRKRRESIESLGKGQRRQLPYFFPWPSGRRKASWKVAIFF